MMGPILLMALLCCAFVGAGQAPRLNVVDGVVFVTGLEDHAQAPNVSEESLKEVFSVYTDEAFLKGLSQPVAGRYQWNPDGFSFEPFYPFSSGTTYHAVFAPGDSFYFNSAHDEPSARRNLDFTFSIPSVKVSSTSVEAVYPASDVLPENLLRMYICFSGQMMPGEAYQHLMLVDETGKRVDRPFLVVDQELWDASRTRLTILFDPGRIKRGLKANLELGPPLKEGGQYSLVIDSTWRDVHGNPLQQSLVKTFRVSAPQRTRLSVAHLTATAPPAASRAPLMLHFDRAMDRALVFRYVTIRDATGNSVGGQLEPHDDNSLNFTPDVPWQEGNYQVSISPLMEDVAGNNFRNAFDLDLSIESRQSSDEAVTLQVAITPLAR